MPFNDYDRHQRSRARAASSISAAKFIEIERKERRPKTRHAWCIVRGELSSVLPATVPKATSAEFGILGLDRKPGASAFWQGDGWSVRPLSGVMRSYTNPPTTFLIDFTNKITFTDERLRRNRPTHNEGGCRNAS